MWPNATEILAKAAFEKAISFAGKPTDVMALAAAVYSREGSWDEAVDLYERALKRLPNSPSLHDEK